MLWRDTEAAERRMGQQSAARREAQGASEANGLCHVSGRPSPHNQRAPGVRASRPALPRLHRAPATATRAHAYMRT